MVIIRVLKMNIEVAVITRKAGAASFECGNEKAIAEFVRVVEASRTMQGSLTKNIRDGLKASPVFSSDKDKKAAKKLAGAVFDECSASNAAHEDGSIELQTRSEAEKLVAENSIEAHRHKVENGKVLAGWRTDKNGVRHPVYGKAKEAIADRAAQISADRAEETKRIGAQFVEKAKAAGLTVEIDDKGNVLNVSK